MKDKQDKKDIQRLHFEQVGELVEMDYLNEDFGFHTDIGDFPIHDSCLRMEMLVIVGCLKGTLQVEINSILQEIQKGEVMICSPNAVVTNWKATPDFKGAALCMTRRWMLEHYSGNELWNKGFHLAEHPIVHLSRESLEMFELYGEVLKRMIQNTSHPYQKDIIIATIKATICEILGNIREEETNFNGAIKNRRELLFKHFISLLASIEVKPRRLDWYADHLCVSSKYLSTVCKQVSGKTAFDWIEQYIQKDIRHWLKNSDRSIKEVAMLLGFPNLSFFGKYCRKHFSLPPTELRQKLQKG